MRDARRHRASILWRRVDAPGHDAATISRAADGWRLDGIALVAHDRAPCRLEYIVHCDDRWATTRCEVTGFVASSDVRLLIERDDRSRWTVDGAASPALDGCDDVDLAFTPATNTLPIRRLALTIGARADVRAAWLRFPELVLEPLEQLYARLDDERYHYESAGGAFTRELRVASSGFVLDYPGLWTADAFSEDTT